MENYFDQQIEMSAKTILALFETNKKQRQSFAQSVINSLENGEIDPLKAHLQLKAMEDIISHFTDKKKYPETAKVWCNAVLEDAQNKGKSFELFNAKFEIKETGVSYDYSKSGDQEWEKLDAQVKELTEKKKAREKFLQFLPAKGIVTTDEETGETWVCYPPAKSSSTSVAVTLK